MNRWFAIHPLRKASAGLVVAFVALMVTFGFTPLQTPPYEPKVMSTLSKERKTFCMGRFSIDLPKGFYQTSGAWGDIELYFGLDKNFKRVYMSVDERDVTREEFIAKVKARRDELFGKLNTVTKKPMLLHEGQIGTNTFLLRRIDKQLYDTAIQTEIHQLVGERYVQYQASSHDTTSPIGKRTTKNIDPGPSEALLAMIAKKLKTEETGGVGFCFQGVIFDVGQDDEVAAFKFRTPEAPDLYLRFNYHAVTGQPEQSLNERISSDSTLMPNMAARLSTYRKRNTRLGGMPAEEVLFKSVKPVVQHMFKIETRTDTQSLARPMISADMMTGLRRVKDKKVVDEPGPSILSDDQVVDLWDEAIQSIRLRRGALPFGMTAMGDWVPICGFGEVCPRSGYWMKQVAHRDFDFNNYHALPRVNQPFKEGEVFLPDIEDELRFRPFTTWTWRRELG